MAEIKLDTRFSISKNISPNNSDIFRIVKVDIPKNEVIFQIERTIDNEVWQTRRKFVWTDVRRDFVNNHYSYI